MRPQTEAAIVAFIEARRAKAEAFRDRNKAEAALKFAGEKCNELSNAEAAAKQAMMNEFEWEAQK